MSSVLEETNNSTSTEDIIKQINENEQLLKQIEDFKDEEEELQMKHEIILEKISKKRLRLDKLEKSCNILKSKKKHNSDQSILRKVFSDAQISILLGHTKTVWSDDDLAMAFSLRQMSSKECYMYLKYTLNMPLPSLSCVQKWASSKYDEQMRTDEV